MKYDAPTLEEVIVLELRRQAEVDDHDAPWVSSEWFGNQIRVDGLIDVAALALVVAKVCKGETG